MNIYTERARNYRAQYEFENPYESYDENDYENDIENYYAEDTDPPVLGASNLDPGKKNFINDIADDVVRACSGTPILPSIKMAQCILESSWGQSRHADPSINNYFGIKAGTAWRGRVVSSTTTEYVRGRRTTVRGTGQIYNSRQEAIRAGADPQSLFRVYNTPEASLRDHTTFITQNARYQPVLRATTYEAQAHALQDNGYATDPEYAQKLIGLIQRHRLYLLDDQSNNWGEDYQESYYDEDFQENQPQITLDAVRRAMQRKYYHVYTRPLELNIVGIRTNDNEANTFNDTLFLFWNENGQTHTRQYRITTDPGIETRQNPDDYNDKKTGVAILAEGQYLASYSLGLHKKKEALVQSAPVTVIRDNDRNAILNFGGKRERGMFGINIHRAGENSSIVDNWSAGCQVFKRSADIEEFLTICKRSKKAGFSSFTYTLINETDLRD
jgi:flagellum-specific peptidoglycan hydrolase FlgJ